MTTVPSWQTAVQGSVDSGAQAVSRDLARSSRRRRVSAQSSRGVVINEMTRIRNPSHSSTGVLSRSTAGAQSSLGVTALFLDNHLGAALPQEVTA